MKIIETNWRWNGTLGRRIGKPTKLIHHNSGGLGTAAGIHAFHISANKWLGIGYHFYIRKDGGIWRGRPEWAMGAHCMNYNHELGICSEGNYQSTKEMPQAQRDAVRWLVSDLHRRYSLTDHKHKDMPGNSTDCPGQYYPWAYVTKAAPRPVTRSKYPALKRAMVAYAKAATPPIPLPPMVLSFAPTWGSTAKELAKRVTRRIHADHPAVPFSTQPTPELYAMLCPPKR